MNTSNATVSSVLGYALGLSMLLCMTAWSVPANDARTDEERVKEMRLNPAFYSCEMDTIAPIIVFPSAGLQANIESCALGQPAIFFFSITIADDCDPAPLYELQVTGGDPSGATLYNPYGTHFLLSALPGSYEITVTATDSTGNRRDEVFAVNVDQGPAPGTNYGCNDTILVSLGDACQRLITPDMILEGGIGCLPPEYFDIQVVDEQPGNGPVVDGPGAYPVELNPQQVSTSEGFTQSADPSLWLLSNRGGASTALSADTLWQTVESQGGWSAAVLPIGFNGTLSFDWETAFELPDSAIFSIQVLNADGSLASEEAYSGSGSGTFQATVSQGQVLWLNLIAEELEVNNSTFRADITNWNLALDEVDLSAAFACWGTVVARDQQPPALTCPPDTDEATVLRAAQQLSGTLTNQSPTLNTGVHSCLSGGLPSNGDRFYDVISFEVDQPGVFTFFLNTAFSDGGGHMAIFQGGFSPLSPCGSILAQHDFPASPNPFNGSSDPYVRLALPLEANQLYYLFTTTDIPGGTGSYTYTVLPDGTGQLSGATDVLLPFTQTLFCEDLFVLQETDSLQWTGVPQVTDNCGVADVSHEDQVEESGDCGALRIQRTFTAVDASGNAADCIQQIDLRRPGVEDISLPPQAFPIDCNLNYPVNGLGNPSPSLTGYPFILTIQGARDLDQVYCNLSASYSDGPAIPVCESSFQFLRTWEIMDWCDPAGSFTFGQIIKVGDFTAPLLSCPAQDLDGDGVDDPLVFPTQPFECTGAFPVPLPDVTDNCSGWEVFTQVVTFRDSVLYNAAGAPVDTIRIEEVLATIPHDAPNRFVSGIPTGCHAFRYLVTDACDNQIERYCTFCVEDRTEPVADCNEQLNVSLSHDGFVRLLAPSVDEGSWDNCAIEQMEVRRLITTGLGCMPVDSTYSDWAPYVDFTCCDIDSLVVIELLVVDTAGNENTCWAEVLIEDKIRPNCSPPTNRTLPCDTLPDGFRPDSIGTLQTLFGTPSVTDNCSATWEELAPEPLIDECGVGTIVRRFQAIDATGNVSNTACEQLVTIEPRHNYAIKFPRDGMSDCGIPNPDTIEIFEMACDLLAVSVTDTVFSASGDECYKIFRTYKVINWCEYDGESPPVVIGRDEDCDEVPGDEDVWVLRRPEHAFVDRDNAHNNSIPAAGTKGTVCNGQTNPEGFWRNVVSNGFWQYKQHIKVYDDEAPQILFIPPLDVCSINNVTCRASAEYLFSVLDNCTPSDLTIEVYYDEYSDGTVDSVFTDIFGTYPKWKLNGDWPIGEHEFEIRVEDGCGNQASATMPFRIVDCLAPAPTCINGLSTPLMPVPPQTDVDGDGDFDRGAATVFATDLIASPYTDCSGPVTYSINRVGEQPGRDQTSIILTCEDLGVAIVEVYAWDSADNPFQIQPDGTVGGPNYDNCETYILVTNNLADCNAPLPAIAGAIERENETPVSGVSVDLSGLLSQSVPTDSLGAYALEGLEPNYDYTVTPFLDGDDQNGLTTYDVVLISRHILGIDHLDSPYQLIAADVNGSGSVSTLDMILLRQVILSILVEIPNGPSWRFIPKSHQFEDPANPWTEPVPYSVTYNDLATSQLGEDYVAVKIGDIDLSAVANGLQATENRGRYRGRATALQLKETYLPAGATLEVPLTSDWSGLSGLQALLHFDPEAVELERVVPGTLPEHFYRHTTGQLGISWNAPAPPEADAPLLYLTLRAKRAVQLSEAVRLEAHPILPECYTPGLEKGPVFLQFASPNGAGQQLEVFPNPFVKEVVVRYYASSTEPAQLRILDQQGRIIWEGQRQPQSVGWQEWLLPEPVVPMNGLYFLRLRSGNQVWSHRLLKLD
ncbi:MAG: T9SS type A sorting domain-containing protein [Phaeodactylibacter sp.]|uniref:T9SS type A sorting domain-containing protein n=1 Tax=Phaeodactylibacter sp. TaxID=1940289 RepID=UPI0032EF67E4